MSKRGQKFTEWTIVTFSDCDAEELRKRAELVEIHIHSNVLNNHPYLYEGCLEGHLRTIDYQVADVKSTKQGTMLAATLRLPKELLDSISSKVKTKLIEVYKETQNELVAELESEIERKKISEWYDRKQANRKTKTEV